MPWNNRDYPLRMKSLHPLIRAKAIEIGNVLLEAGEEEGRAIRVAINEAKQSMGVNHARMYAMMGM